MPRPLRDRLDEGPTRARLSKAGGNRRAPDKAPRARGKTRESSGVRRRPVSNIDQPPAPKNRRRAPTPPEVRDEAAEETRAHAPSAGRWADAKLRLRARLGWLMVGLRWLARALFVVACVAGLWAAGRLLRQHALTSAYFAVDAIELTGNERLSREALLSAAGLGVGHNIFEVSPVEAQRKLEALPWVASARVERHLPRSLTLRVVEHHAAALLALSSLYLVDRDGSVFSELGPEDPVDLPVLTGVDEARFRGDRHYRVDALSIAASILEDVRAAGLYRRLPVQEIHLAEDGGLDLVMGEDALLVALGRGPYRPKLRRLRRVLDGLARRHQLAQRVFLDNERRPSRVVVRLVDAPTAR
ncbi:MAG: FtsQ-type POTRA domain-containing protein [Deltaproteobacteria bacterium]|nr:FtsQ-type POTRA domain-containing protein [Deltaproteobacteria bacterium]